MLSSESYKQSLDKNRQRDSRYMKELQKKLSMAIDMWVFNIFYLHLNIILIFTVGSDNNFGFFIF
jgi:hypothetical protein